MTSLRVIRLDTEVDEQPERDELELAVAYAARMRKLRDQYANASADAEERVMQLLAERGRKTFAARVGDKVWKTTVVTGELVKIDEKSLAKAVGAPLWGKITDRKLNRSKLEQLIATGEIPADVVASHSTIQPKKPYVRLTETDEPEPAELDEGSN